MSGSDILALALASVVPMLAVIAGIVIEGAQFRDFRRNFDAHMDRMLKRSDER